MNTAFKNGDKVKLTQDIGAVAKGTVVTLLGMSKISEDPQWIVVCTDETVFKVPENQVKLCSPENS